MAHRTLFRSAAAWARAGLGPLLAFLMALVAAPAAHAQSAADKATARQLATEGIKEFRAKQYAAALDRLERAQALYEAPIHLLYIARCQVALGQLVEGSETYRNLARVQLVAGSPKAFTEAQRSGEKELEALTPRLPSLTIDVEPDGIEALELYLGQEALAAAVEGIARPVNPGEYTVTAKAPGYDAAEGQVTIAERASERVLLTLKKAPAAEGGPSAASAPAVPDADEPGPVEEKAHFGFEFGLRGGGLAPRGELVAGVPMADTIDVGGGGEVHAALRFLKYFSVGGFYNRFWMFAGSLIDSSLAGLDPAPASMSASPGLQGAGFLLRVASERGKFGGFGEIGVEVLHRLTVSRDLEGLDSAPTCRADQYFSGTALRLAGGGILPLNRWVRLTPMLSVSFSTYSSTDVETACGTQTGEQGLPPLFGQAAGDIDPSAMHQLVFFGLGGDLMLGDD